MKKTIFAALLLCLVACNKGSYDSIGEDCVPPYEPNQCVQLRRNNSTEQTARYIPDREHSENLPADALSEWQKISVFVVPAHSSVELTYDSNDNYLTPVETYGVEDNMVFYVFKKTVWDSNDWKALVSNKLWSGKCSLSVQQALAQSRTVTYPMP